MDLPYLTDEQQKRRATPKPLPHQLVKEAKDQEKADKGKAFRDEIWKLDEGKCRATKKPLKRSGTTKWDELGEVDHSIPRSLAPELIYEPSNGLLLQKRLNRLRKVPCPKAPEFRMFDYSGPDDRRQLQTFVWRDEDGKITKTVVG